MKANYKTFLVIPQDVIFRYANETEDGSLSHQ